MTVKELKDFLEECDDDMEVTTMCSGDGCYWKVPANCEIKEVDGVKTVYIGDEHNY